MRLASLIRAKPVCLLEGVNLTSAYVQMTLGGPGCRLQTCRRREAQWFDSTFWAALLVVVSGPHQNHGAVGPQV